jgi:abortive infection alpha-like protein
MTDPTSLVPISDEQAKAAQEAFKAFQEAVKALVGAGKFLRETFGTVPEDVVALLGGNWLKVRRAEQLAGMLAKTEERLHARRVEGHEPSLSIALPIFVAAADENREELQDIWARLLAAAADPARAKSFRLAFIETAKKMDPLDAAVLQGIHAVGGAVTGQNRNALADQLHATRDEIDVSVANLIKLELVYSSRPESTAVAAGISALGREFLRTISD